MRDPSAIPRRRWIRGGVFWLCIATSAAVAGSWVKSYWRSHAVSCTPISISYVIGDKCGRFVLVRWHRPMSPLPLELSVYPVSRTTGPSWKFGGFNLDGDSGGRFYRLLIPHWFVLGVCLAGAWWADPPRRRNRGSRRGFEMVATNREAPKS